MEDELTGAARAAISICNAAAVPEDGRLGLVGHLTVGNEVAVALIDEAYVGAAVVEVGHTEEGRLRGVLSEAAGVPACNTVARDEFV